MEGMTCDMCGKVLLGEGESVRYVARVELFAAYDPLELTQKDLDRDLSAEIRHLLRQVEDADPRALEEDVYKEFRFDLCPTCHKKVLADPLGLRRRTEGPALDGE